MRLGRSLALCTVAAHLFAAPAGAAVVPTDFVDELVLSGPNTPVNSTLMPDGRLVFVEQYTGNVRMIVNGAFAAIDPVGTVSEVRAGGEQGLVGVALDPNWPERPYVYVMANHDGSQTVRLWRYTLQGDLTFSGNGAMSFVPGSRYTVIADIPDITPSHQAGSLRFGPDGMLYVAMGDDEQNCAAQDKTSLRGKILRLEVAALPDGPGGPPRYETFTPADNPFASDPDSVARLVWAFGLRNPYMTSMDLATGCLVVGDVGNMRYEEVNVVCEGGRNFGWPFYEGPERTTIVCAGADTSALTAPYAWYPHVGAGYSVIGGPIYRTPPGATNPFPPEYEGTAFYGDTWRGFLRRIVPDGSGGWERADSVAGQPDSVNWLTGPKWITSLHVAPDGSLNYFLIYRTVPTSGQGELRRIRYVNPLVGAPRDEPETSAGEAVSLDAPWPAPSSGAVDLAFRLARPSSVRLVIVDARGRAVRTLLDARAGVQPAGPGRARWDGRDTQGRLAPSGVYFARLEAGGLHAARRFVRLTGE